MYDVVFVRFEHNKLEECEGLYIDGKQIGRLDDSYRIMEDLMEFLEKQGVLTYRTRYIEKDVAERFVGVDRYQDYEEYDRAERDVKLEKAAKLREQAAALQAEAEALEVEDECGQ